MIFRLYENVKLVKGLKRSIIYDLQLSRYYLVPNSMYYVLRKCYNRDVDSYINELAIEDREIVNEYLEFLVRNELGHFINKGDLTKFPKVKFDFEIDYKVNNLIIDVKDFVRDDVLNEVKKFIDANLIEALMINIKTKQSFKELDLILSYFFETTIQDIQILIPYDSWLLEDEKINFIINQHLRISQLHIHSSPIEKTADFNGKTAFVIYKTDKIDLHTSCGTISEQNFYINTSLFTENHNVNTCLYGKLFIDEKGNIKPCHSIDIPLGSIFDININQLLENKTLRNLWHIDKKSISVCKVCEYRYMCTDCRAFLENPQDLYSKPLKCGYDPYTSKWEDWFINPLKEKVIEFYGMQELVKT